MFDSHSRDERGLFVEYGSSVLMEFKDIFELEKYIQVAYLEFRDFERQYFQAEFISLNMEQNVREHILSSFRLERRRVSYYDSHIRTQMDQTPVNRGYTTATETGIDRVDSGSKRMHKSFCKKEVDNLDSGSTEKVPKNCSTKKSKFRSKESKIAKFRKEITEGPVFVCVECNRCMYRRSVKIYKSSNYNIQLQKISVLSFDGSKYICRTCDKHLLKGKIPCQSVRNKLQIYSLPDDLASVRRLERVLVSKRILFKKVTIMPRGQSPKIKGAL